MKKIVLLLLAGLLLVPAEMFPKKHTCKKVIPIGSPIRMPSQYFISLYLDEETGELSITPNYNITELTINLSGNGVTYLDTSVSLSAGQSYTDSLSSLNPGTYLLTLSTADGIIDQYLITVESD